MGVGVVVMGRRRGARPGDADRRTRFTDGELGAVVKSINMRSMVSLENRKVGVRTLCSCAGLVFGLIEEPSIRDPNAQFLGSNPNLNKNNNLNIRLFFILTSGRYDFG